MSRRSQFAYPVATDYAVVSGAEAAEKRPLPKEGYTHISVNTPVVLVPADAPEPIRNSDFNTRWANHRLTMTLRPYGKWLTEVRGPEAPTHEQIDRDSSYSPYGRPIEYQGIAKVRHNVSIPQPTTLGELVGDG